MAAGRPPRYASLTCSWGGAMAGPGDAIAAGPAGPGRLQAAPGGTRPPAGGPRRTRAGDWRTEGRVRAKSADRERIRRAAGPGIYATDVRGDVDLTIDAVLVDLRGALSAMQTGP